MSLYRAETRRLAKRRFTRWMLVGGLVILAAVAVGVFFSNQKVGPEQIAAAKADAAANYQENLRFAEEARQRCEQAKGTPEEQNPPEDCAQIYTPTPEEYDYQNFMPATFDFRQNFGDMVITFAAILALTGFVIGASYVGAEWSSGGMMNLLLWRPQRIRVLATKLAALLIAITAVTVVVAAVWTAVFVLIAKLRGSTAGMTSGAWQSFALMELRGLGLILAVTALGFGIASLGRHTALALGAAIGVIVIFQFGLVAVLSTADVRYAEIWLLPTWGIAWMQKKLTLQDYNSCDFSATQGCQPAELTLTWPMAGGLMAVALVLVVGGALWTIRSRDIT